MKMLNVLELLCESKVDFVKKRYAAKIIASYRNRHMGISYSEDEEIPEKVINGIVIFVDPSMKYLEWVVKQYIAGLYNEEEDDEQVKEDLEEFEKHKRKMQHQDINRYNLNTLRLELAKFAEYEDGGDFHQQIQDAIEKGIIDYIGNQNGIDIYHTLTKEGNILLGRGGGHDNLNKWCTSRPDDKNMFEFYNTRKNCDIYVWIFKDGKRFQCDVSRTTSKVQNWMDESDNDIVKHNSNIAYWEQMRTTPFMIGIRNKALQKNWDIDSYNTTFGEFVTLSMEHEESFTECIQQVVRNNRLFRTDFPAIIKGLQQYDGNRLISELEIVGNLQGHEQILSDLDKAISQDHVIISKVYNNFTYGDDEQIGDVSLEGVFVETLYYKGRRLHYDRQNQ